MTKFRPCIDLHQGLVKQVVGGSFDDSDNDQPIENFVSNKDSKYDLTEINNDVWWKYLTNIDYPREEADRINDLKTPKKSKKKTQKGSGKDTLEGNRLKDERRYKLSIFNFHEKSL